MGTVRIPLNSRKYPNLFALIDEDDYELVSPYSWHVFKSRNTLYARFDSGKQRLGGTRFVFMHRLLMFFPDGMVDHINGDGLDNRRSSNLRVADRYQNTWNTRPVKGPYKGIFQKDNGKWRAGIRHRGARYWLGTFDTPEEAACAYDAAATDLHGAFARLNFPDSHMETDNER